MLNAFFSPLRVKFVIHLNLLKNKDIVVKEILSKYFLLWSYL